MQFLDSTGECRRAIKTEQGHALVGQVCTIGFQRTAGVEGLPGQAGEGMFSSECEFDFADFR
ncbi:hypothetical protein SDC9_182384 [bioreactor metagenome]|uniref:Uncharacterized protein n=1 Tax=bioreactor metagenome TaxID=1076179 RepID=A0A645H877_9ZZZZ